MVEPSFRTSCLKWDPFSPMWTSTRYVSTNGQGLARPSGRNARGQLSLIQITWTKYAIARFNTNCADSISALNKLLMAVIRNIFVRNNNVNVVLIHHQTKHHFVQNVNALLDRSDLYSGSVTHTVTSVEICQLSSVDNDNTLTAFPKRGTIILE